MSDAVVMEVVPARVCPDEQMAMLFDGAGWPAFIDADRVAAAALPRIRQLYPDHELALVDGDRVVAAGWGVPLYWDGTVAGLPSGYSDSLARALTDHENATPTNTFVVCAVQVSGDEQGRGIAATAITALVEHALSRGLVQVIAPLRPTWKHRYPLTSIADYVGWLDDDGLPLDPWLRLHLRLGAQLLTTSENSQTFTGTVDQWAGWSGLRLPATGRYIVSGALSPLEVDIAEDVAVCHEPGIWVRHR